MEDILKEIDTLFTDAKSKNEFQFLLTILNYKHISNPKESSNLYEWFDAIDFYKQLYHEHSGEKKLRIGLLLYSTFFENSDFYNIIGSLCRNALGFGGSSYLLWKTKKQERLLGTGEKVRAVSELLSDCNYQKLIFFFSTVHFEQLRNTFFHSAYGINEGEYFLFDSEPIVTETFSSTRVSINDFLLPLINTVIQFFDKFKTNYLQSFKGYTAEKHIQGYFPDLKDIIIHGAAEGLKGITIKKTAQFYGEWTDSGIYFSKEYQFWFAKNIHLNFPQIETIEIDETLTRYESKQDIKTSDSEFTNLVDKIAERNDKTEMVRIIDLLIKFGNVKYDKWQAEQNPHKKKSIQKLPLTFYERAIQFNKHLDLTETKNRVKELEKE